MPFSLHYIVGVLQASWHLKTKQLEAVAQKCSVNWVFLEIS